MRFTYDSESDAAFIYVAEHIGDGEVARSHMCDLELREGAVILMLNTNGCLLGIEILGASRLLPPDVLATANEG